MFRNEEPNADARPYSWRNEETLRSNETASLSLLRLMGSLSVSEALPGRTHSALGPTLPG